MEVTLVGRGSYVSICTFFDRLARLNRLSKLQDLEVTAGSGSEYPIEAKLLIFFGLSGKEGQSPTEVKRG
jgi:hypothetical protein